MSTDDEKPPREDLDAGLRFVHLMDMQTRLDLDDVTATVYALAEELVGSGAVDVRGLQERRDRIQKENATRQAARAHVQIGPSVDKYAQESPPIPCASLMELCKGRCCQLNFSLTFQDLDEGTVRWNYSRPYEIRKRADGYCVHSDVETHGCGVYAARPAVCRTYDCRTDKRIWVDFEKRIPVDDTLVPPPTLRR